jgi:hypothetical protein
MYPLRTTEKPPRVADLVGERADLYLLGESEPIKDALILYVSRSWLGVEYLFRRVRHRLHIPVAGVAKIDQRHRLPPLRRK